MFTLSPFGLRRRRVALGLTIDQLAERLFDAPHVATGARRLAQMEAGALAVTPAVAVAMLGMDESPARRHAA